MDADTPAPVLPKLTRKKNRIGQEHGPFFIKVGGRKVNLRTENYIIARERAREAYFDGKTDFQDQRFFDTTKSAEPDVKGPSSDWANDLASAAASGLKPDQYAAPSGETMPLLGAMPKVPGEEESPKIETPQTDGPESTKIPPEMFAGMLNQLAMILVEAQLQGQEYLIKRMLAVQAGPVSMSNIGRTAGVDFWKQQLRKWLPEDVPLPEWAAAMCAVLMFGGTAQLQGATPIVKKPATETPPFTPG